jgi:hypothetical protein
VVIGRGQAGRFADRAVDVSDGAARPAHDMVVVVSEASLEPAADLDVEEVLTTRARPRWPAGAIR